MSFVMPAYNEEAIVGQTIRRVLGAFGNAGIPLQLVVVDNGSRDRTGEIIRQLAQEHPQITPVRVEKNVGYGSGILSGIPACVAPWVGVIPADGQVDAEDAVRLFEDAVASGLPVLAKARRRFRMDGPSRKVVSIAYNLFFRSLFPGFERRRRFYEELRSFGESPSKSFRMLSSRMLQEISLYRVHDGILEVCSRLVSVDPG